MQVREINWKCEMLTSPLPPPFEGGGGGASDAGGGKYALFQTPVHNILNPSRHISIRIWRMLRHDEYN